MKTMAMAGCWRSVVLVIGVLIAALCLLLYIMQFSSETLADVSRSTFEMDILTAFTRKIGG